MVSVNEAVSRGLAFCFDLGLQDLPALCSEGDTISLMRLFHYFPYRNESDFDHVGGKDPSGARSHGPGKACDCGPVLQEEVEGRESGKGEDAECSNASESTVGARGRSNSCTG